MCCPILASVVLRSAFAAVTDPPTTMCDSYVDSGGYTLCPIGLEPVSGGDEVVCADGPCDDDTCCVVPGERERGDILAMLP